jgi:hypothetical protein
MVRVGLVGGGDGPREEPDACETRDAAATKPLPMDVEGGDDVKISGLATTSRGCTALCLAQEAARNGSMHLGIVRLPSCARKPGTYE